jgi:hypothetical protein
MKKIIASILIVACLIIFVISIKTEVNTTNIKMVNFSNNFFGLSLLYPEYLAYTQPTESFVREPEETVLFTYNKKEIFRINLEYEKFNKDNKSEYLFPEEKTKFEKIKSLSFVNEALAMTGPEPVKMDVKKVIFGDNTFYTYAYSLNGKRVDKFFIPQEFNTIVFTFYNQKEQFIKNILSSIKRIDGIYSLEGKQIVKNENIGLEKISIPRNWLVTNNSTSTVVKYYSQDRSIEILITNFDTKQNSIPEKMEKLKSGNLTTVEERKIRDSLGCGINSWLYLNNGLSGCAIENDGEIKAYYKINNKKIYIYYDTIFKKENRLERLYLTEILDSIIASDKDIFKN